MEATQIKLGEIVREVEEQCTPDNRESLGGGWCEDIYIVRLSAEEIENLICLGDEHPNLVAKALK